MTLPDRTQDLARHRSLPRLDGYEPQGAMAIESEVCVAEQSFESDPSLAWTCEAVPGVWYVYVQLDDDEGYPLEALVVHHTAVAAIARARWTETARVDAVGATMMIADKDATLDDAFQAQRRSARPGVFASHGFYATLGHEGWCTISVVDGAASPIQALRVDFR